MFLGIALAIVAAAAFALVANLRGAGATATRAATPDAAMVTTVYGRVPIREALARFSAGLPRVIVLEHGAPDRDALVERFIAAVEGSDTAAVRALVISRAEFAYLYFPHSVFSKPPYRQDPALAWFLSLQDSQKGITRVFNRFAGTAARLSGYHCSRPVRAEGPFRIWEDCQMIVRETENVERLLRLFGPIIEYEGRYKFLTYANDM